MITNNKDKWIPEIFYEEKQDGLTQGLPFVNIPKGKVMPSSVFICGVEPSQEDEEEKEITVHMYCNMNFLKERLEPETLNKIRISLGLKPLEDAIREGKKITERIHSNIDKISE
tara:strand:- start:544 stop:885 length:342 start_codon:yes stop_codon:yes gene_type:complete